MILNREVLRNHVFLLFFSFFAKCKVRMKIAYTARCYERYRSIDLKRVSTSKKESFKKESSPLELDAVDDIEWRSVKFSANLDPRVLPLDAISPLARCCLSPRCVLLHPIIWREQAIKRLWRSNKKPCAIEEQIELASTIAPSRAEPSRAVHSLNGVA